MKRHAISVAVWIFVTTAASVFGQTPDLSGTWTLDVESSRITTPPLHGGGDGGGPADTLHITHAANGTLIVGNEVNTGQAWAYEPGGDSSIPIRGGGTITVTSRWEGSRFVSEGSQEPGGGDSITGVKEVRWLSADGQTLTVDVTTRTLEGDSTNTVVYRKAKVGSPAKLWYLNGPPS